MIKITDIHYIAGLLEGEGYFGFAGGPNIQMTSTDLDVMRKYRKVVKASNEIRINNSPNTRGYKTQYNLNVCASLAAQWMMTLYPLMGNRRKEQIKSVLTQWKAMTNNDGYCKKGHSLLGSNTVAQSNGHVKCYICSYTSRKIREERMSY